MVCIAKPPESQRLTFREISLDALPFFCRLYGDMDHMKYVRGRALSYEETKASLIGSLNQIEKFGYGFWITVLKENSAMIGRSGYIVRDITGPRETEIAYMFLKEYWGLGLATEVGAALIEYAFTELNIRRLIGIIDPENRASMRVAERIGMRVERTIVVREKDKRFVYVIERRH